jgi:two-component system KDP operon response regulator KdpE
VPPRILVVDDEPNIVASVRTLLGAAGYEVAIALSGGAALDIVERETPDVIVLDLGLPDINGVDVCRIIREDRTVPIVVLSARGTEGDKVRALDAGADDYVTKPFGSNELLARIRVALRRAAAAVPPGGQLATGDLVIDLDRNRVLRHGTEIRLTPKELDLLLVLARHAGRVLTHRTLLKAIWGPHGVDKPEHLRVLIATLRKKIEPDPSNPKYLVSEPWVGYRFVDAGAGDTG